MAGKKEVKPKYAVGEYIKQDGKKYKIIQVCTTTYVVVNLENNQLAQITFEGLRKFKPSDEDLEIYASLIARSEFNKPLETEELNSSIQFPNEENLAVLAASTEIGFDIETYGLEKVSDAFFPEKGNIRLLQVYLPTIDKTIIWDCGDLRNQKSFSELLGINILKKKLVSYDCKVYIHNADFESKWIGHHLKVPINNVVDSMILSQIYWAGLSRGFNAKGIKKPNSLEQVALRCLGIKPDKTNQTYDYALPLGNNQYNYAALDAALTYKCGVKLLADCYKEGLQKVVDADLSAIPAFSMMNYRGIPVSKAKLEELIVQYQAAADKAIEPWLQLFPGTNPGSPKQVLACLEKQWGITPTKVDMDTGEDKPCTDNPTLTSFALENPAIDGLLFWRSLIKDVEYLQQYLEHVIEVNGFQVIRPNYRQNADNCTGRSSSSRPNAQNIPTPTEKRKALGLEPIRSAFIAPPGYKMIIVDLAGSHGQIARYVAQDKKLIEANNSGTKFHFYTVQGILEMEGKKVEVKDLAKAKKDKSHPLAKEVSRLYDPSKTVFYGGLNLQSAKTLQNSFLKKADMVMSIEVCQQYVKGFRTAYADIYKCQRKLIDSANSRANARQFTYQDEFGNTQQIGVLKGYYGTAKSIDGGRLFIEKMPSKFNNGAWEVKGTDAVSYMWLRTEGTIMRKSLGNLVKHIRQNKIDGWICQFTHDEVGSIVKEEQAYNLANYTVNMITNTFKEFVPDYQAESLDPKDYICNMWSEK